MTRVKTGKRGGTNQRPELPADSPYHGQSYDAADVLTTYLDRFGSLGWGSKRRLAAQLGCDPSIVGLWASGKRRMPGYWVPTVARVLGISEAELIAGGGIAPHEPDPRSLPLYERWALGTPALVIVGPCVDPSCSVEDCRRWFCNLCESYWAGVREDHACARRAVRGRAEGNPAGSCVPQDQPHSAENRSDRHSPRPTPDRAPRVEVAA